MNNNNDLATILTDKQQKLVNSSGSPISPLTSGALRYKELQEAGSSA